MSRLEFAPKLNEIEVTDFQKGLGVFTPKTGKPVSFSALKDSLKKAGYTLNSADITVSGKLAKDEHGFLIVVPPSTQKFVLAGPNVVQAIAGLEIGGTVELTGDWKTNGSGPTSYEVITPTGQKTANRSSVSSNFYLAKVSFDESNPRDDTGTSENHKAPLQYPHLVAAPIRVTSPGLTVYKGGAVTPRLYFIKQHLGTMEVDRQVIDLSVSYTPSPRLQLELEIPFSRTSYDDKQTVGSGSGLGNLTTWAKYRFFRKVKTYGDRQAAFRVGLELPSGKKNAPTQSQINVSEFVRAQLSPINGGLSPHFDLALSQAGGRIIFGGNAEAILRTQRDGFRMGHEQRLNTDLEYVIPRDPHKPGGELFLILETTFVHRSTGRLNGLAVSGSKATEYFLAPGLQYAAHPRFVLEGSYQFPVLRNTGPLVLRTDRNVLIGMKWLF